MANISPVTLDYLSPPTLAPAGLTALHQPRQQRIPCTARRSEITSGTVEIPCYKCGAGVEEGTPFCPQCNAPLIRVGGAGISEIPQAATDPASAQVVYPDTSAVQWSQALPSAALAGLLTALLMFVPLAAFGIGMIAGGMFSVLFYRRRVPGVRLTGSAGAKLGALSGTLGFCIFSIFTSVEVLVFHSGGELRATMLQAIQQSAARSSDPQAQQVVEYLKSPAGLALLMGFSLAVMFVVFLIFSSLGGALAAALFRKRDGP